MNEAFAMGERLTTVHYVTIVLSLLAALAAAGHALLYKRDPRAALGWAAVCLTFPLAGPLLYFLFGINRIKTRARKLARRSPLPPETTGKPHKVPLQPIPDVPFPAELAGLAHVSDAVTRRPLVGGNRIETLQNGEEAYPAMLDAIETARRSVYLSTYIFETNVMGRRFIEALGGAEARGVDVRVIIDGIGELYASRRAGTLLRKRGVRVARFLPPGIIPPSLHINLRNHRKVLVADGLSAFVGGMNIGDRHMAEALGNPSRVIDTHFRLSGPIVGQIEQVFGEDWGFLTGELPPRSAPAPPQGSAVCRAVVDGPSEDLGKLSMILVGAISSARSRISIVTPYFLPTQGLISAMEAAALRGVAVDVILPSRNNLPFVHWATRKMLWEVLQRGVRVYYQPPPFVHTKLFIVDDFYALVGSANMDPRSLRLNFELVVEVYDEEFVRNLRSTVETRKAGSAEVTLSEMDGRPLPAKIRDALAWVFSPYL